MPPKSHKPKKSKRIETQEDLDLKLALELQAEYEKYNDIDTDMQRSEFTIIREQQDLAYNKSLLADREKERIKKEKEIEMEVEEKVLSLEELRQKRLEKFTQMV
jgi:hypothetical protein